MVRDLGGHRIRVNTVVPGWIMTERQKELWVTPETLVKQIDRQCQPDAIDPVYVAQMVLFLASEIQRHAQRITSWLKMAQSKQDRTSKNKFLNFCR